MLWHLSSNAALTSNKYRAIFQPHFTYDTHLLWVITPLFKPLFYNLDLDCLFLPHAIVVGKNHLKVSLNQTSPELKARWEMFYKSI